MKLGRLLNVVEGFKSFILIVALSIYDISFSRSEYANLSSIATPVVVCSVSPCDVFGRCNLYPWYWRYLRNSWDRSRSFFFSLSVRRSYGTSWGWMPPMMKQKEDKYFVPLHHLGNSPSRWPINLLTLTSLSPKSQLPESFN